MDANYRTGMTFIISGHGYHSVASLFKACNIEHKKGSIVLLFIHIC